MSWPALCFSLVVAGQAPGVEAAHDANPVYRSLLDDGALFDDKRVTFPPPLLVDGQTGEVQREALRKLAGSDRALAELLRDSVTAPFILKLQDDETAASLIRRADLWFAVRADLDAFDPDATALRASDPKKPVEAGNMKFTTRLLLSAELAARGVEQPKAGGTAKTWFVHQTGRLLDRIHVQVTDLVVATHSPESWVIASRTDPRFDESAALANRWWAIVRKGGQEEAGPPRRSPGGASYAKVSRLASDPKVLLVEAHFAFAEPRAWFDGAPILRSKIGLIAQEQVRQLRRELARRAARPPAEKSPG